ncbi:ATP-binding protein [uncultured Parolsenella sp.]|uniref:ATP-binding protein n=1 Tax=uncultured Parolsenella sp. TaxID=2083008 RepID=UPI0025F895F9|nr:ATP-binding protein [uncultured Parolsenella sp.]
MIARESYFDQIAPFVGKNIIKVLIGVRRCGKSTLLQMLYQRFLEQGVPAADMLHIRLESSEFSHLDTADRLTEYVYAHIDKSRPVKLLFDEIQEVQGWENALRSFMVDLDADIYITGSNAHVLSSDLATYITGRYVTIDVYPLSFAEFLPAYQASHPESSERAAFVAYATQGGFPFQSELAFQTGPTLKYLDDLLSTILLKDVVKRNGIRDVDLLERLVRFSAAEEGHLLSVKRIADFLKSERRKTTTDTIANHLNAAEKAYLLYRAPREDAIGKQLLAFNEKWYVVDQGLRQAMGMSNQANIDQVLEGIVFMELKRRGYSVTVGKVDDLEVDFVARRGTDVEYYQVTYLMADEHTREREFASLLAIPDNYPKYVLSMDDFCMTQSGVDAINIVDWLLGR